MSFDLPLPKHRGRIGFNPKRLCSKQVAMLLSVLSILAITAFSYYTLVLSWDTSTSPFSQTLPAKSHSSHVPKLGAVSSGVFQCSQIGIDILKYGGNAADAMIATEFCLGVIAMQSTGLGAGGFMLIRSPNGTYEFVDFRETAPAAAFQDMFNLDDNLSILGGLASGIPGSLRGLEYLHKTYAKLPWRRLITPSIGLARKGFPASEDLIFSFSQIDDISFFTKDPAWSVDFAPNGTLIGVGDIIKRPRYAKLLEDIANKGGDVFYTGSIAKQTIAALQAANGSMTLQDLKDYSIVLRRPLSIEYHGYKITSCSAPSSGAVVLSAMKTLEGYAEVGEPSFLNISTHRLDESTRFAYGARTELADASFFSNISIFEDEMIKDITATNIRSKILDNTTLPVAAYNPNGIESLETPGTSHAVTADSTGMSVSLTSTINLYFGSKLIVPETGLIMNNEMNDFSIPGFSDEFGYIASPVNYVTPGKRPMSSMSPTIVEFLSNNTLYLALGGAGGSYIITAVIQCLWNVLDRNMTSPEALEEPRFHDQLVPNNIELEWAYNNSTVAYMASLEHNVTRDIRWSVVSALRRLPNGTFEGAGEPSFVESGGFAV